MTWLVQFDSGTVQSIVSIIVWEEQMSSSRSLPAEIPVRRPGVCRLSGGMVCSAVSACLSGVWCGVGVMQIQFKAALKSSFSSVRLPYRVGFQFIQFGSGHGDRVPPFSLFSPVHSVQFANSSGPALHRKRSDGTSMKPCQHLPTPHDPAANSYSTLWLSRSPVSSFQVRQRLRLGL